MTIHIGAEKGDIAPTVLMPGDPLRAKWAAENFLTDTRLVNQVRGMLGYTGTYHGNPVTIHGSGMGMPNSLGPAQRAFGYEYGSVIHFLYSWSKGSSASLKNLNLKVDLQRQLDLSDNQTISKNNKVYKLFEMLRNF